MNYKIYIEWEYGDCVVYYSDTYQSAYSLICLFKDRFSSIIKSTKIIRVVNEGSEQARWRDGK